ncbi:hypothetical protein ACFV97_30475 [Streptomyces sp. NPDC059913]|uniref:hypothetical protein n=1 Tax=unclassified Streptomyces TaxID=2593676 RepID=UPI00366039DD
MHRTNLAVAAHPASWIGLGLEVGPGTGPGLRPEMAGGNRMALWQGPDAVFRATVDEDRGGVAYSRTEAYRSPVAPLRAAEARAVEGVGRPSWYARWAHRFADALEASSVGPLHEGRWMLTPRLDHRLGRGREETTRNGDGPTPGRWCSPLLDAHPDGYVDWFAGGFGVVPLRRMPAPGDGRVKSYRRQVRDGVLPPVLLWWFSGLDRYVVLDGHARLAAALAEDREPAALALSRAPSEERAVAGTDRALSAYRLTLSVLDGPHPVADREHVVRAAGRLLTDRLSDVATDRAPTRAWPMRT